MTDFFHNPQPGRRRRKKKFNPNRDYVEQAVKDFLKKGGKIKKLDPPYYELYDIYNQFRSGSAIDLSILD
jgi:hypothetical protein